MRWVLSWKKDQEVREIADRHYNRQKPGSVQFAPPGRTLILKAYGPVEDSKHDDGLGVVAAWITSWKRYANHDWPGWWNNTLFRNEGLPGVKSSELIEQALAVTRWYHEVGGTRAWREANAPPGIITFVAPECVSSRNPGWCYRCAGFDKVGITSERGRWVFARRLETFPPPAPPAPALPGRRASTAGRNSPSDQPKEEAPAMAPVVKQQSLW